MSDYTEAQEVQARRDFKKVYNIHNIKGTAIYFKTITDLQHFVRSAINGLIDDKFPINDEHGGWNPPPNKKVK